MTKNLGLLNLGNMSNSFNDKEILCSRQLMKKIAILKERGTQLLHSVKYKFDGEFPLEKEILKDQRTDHEDLNITVTGPKKCICSKTKLQSKWRSRINDIGSITRLALRKKRNTNIISQSDIRNVKNQSATLSPQTENARGINEKSSASTDPESNSEILSKISKGDKNNSKLSRNSKDDKNRSRLSTLKSQNAAAEESNVSSDPEPNPKILSEISKGDKNNSKLSRNSKDDKNRSRLSSLKSQNATAEESNVSSDPEPNPKILSKVSKGGKNQLRLSNLKSQNVTAVAEESNVSSDPEPNPKILSEISKGDKNNSKLSRNSKDDKNRSRLSSLKSQNARAVAEESNVSSDPEPNPKILSEISKDDKNNSKLSRNSKDDKNRSRLSSLKSQNVTAVAEESDVSSDPEPNPELLTKVSKGKKNQSRLSRISKDGKNRSRLSSLKSQNATAIAEESNASSGPEPNPEILSKVSKDGKNQSILPNLKSQNATVVAEESNVSSGPEVNPEILSNISKGKKNQSRLSNLKSQNATALAEESSVSSDPKPNPEILSKISKSNKNQSRLSRISKDDNNAPNDLESNPEKLSKSSKGGKNESRLSNIKEQKATTIVEELNISNDPANNPEILSKISKGDKNQLRLPSPKAQNATAIAEESNVSGDSARNPETLSKISKGSQNKSRLPNLKAENSPATVIEKFNSLSVQNPISETLPKISKDSEILAEVEKPKNDATSRTPNKRQSREKERKSSIKSQRTSLPLAVKPTKTIAKNEAKTRSRKIEEINDGVIKTLDVTEERKELERATIHLKEPVKNVEEVQQVVDIATDIKKEQPVQFVNVNISRKEFDNMVRDKDARKIIRIDHKSLPPDVEQLSAIPAIQTNPYEEWRDIPSPVIDEIRRVTKPKLTHECSRACPCKFSQELINMYHETKLLSEKANKTSEGKDHCKFRMTTSEVEFFKGDTKMCNVMIGETQSRRAEMRELMDMWQEANEKLSVRKKEIFNIVESIEKTNKRMDEVQRLLKDWLPGDRMEKLRNAQRANEKKDQERMEMLEDEERTFCKKKIEQIIQKRDAWQADEELREEKRKNQRQKDTLALQNATNLMQKYIDERKSLLLR